jgi:Na+/H+ antiporter NhaD/arsenite permease-like protein
MVHLTVWITILTFLVTLGFILWRPKNINEAIPATLGLLLLKWLIPYPPDTAPDNSITINGMER